MKECTLSVIKKENYSLDEVIRKVQTGAVPVGSYFSCNLIDGTKVDFVVTAIEDDAIRLESRDCLGKYVKHYKKNLDTFFKNVYDVLPEALRNEIIKTDRVGYNEDSTVEHTVCKLFLPAASEIFPDADCYGDKGLYKQMDYYKDPRNRVRCLVKDGDPDWYWTSSRRAGDASAWCLVDSNGAAYTTHASHDWIAAPVCFRIRKS